MTRLRGRPTKAESKPRIFPATLSLVEQQHLAVIAAKQGVSIRKLASRWLSERIKQEFVRTTNIQRRRVIPPSLQTVNTSENYANTHKASFNAVQTAKKGETDV